MCILCEVQKWSRRVFTMLPWFVIPLIGLWALSQLLPPAFRFEITSPRLACVSVLLLTLFWYEILMPKLSAWRARRNAQLRERKRFEAIEMQKLRKTATRRCRNCLTPYRDQNRGGGKFMCSYCGHISKRPVLDSPVPSGMGLSNAGILKDLVGKGGKILNGKVWSDNCWICGQDWLENGSWVCGSLMGKSSYWQENGDVFFDGDDHCLAENSYSCVIIFACKVLTTLFLSITWLWRKIFGVSSSRDDASTDAERRGVLTKRSENGGNCHESRGEKARRKAEEKRQAKLEKELLEEEERKQREEVARLVEERRRLRDEKMEAEKDGGKGSPSAREKDGKREAEKKRQERKKEKERGSSKSNSDAEELEKRTCEESERSRKSEADRWEHHKTGAENLRSHNNEMGNGFKGANTTNYVRGNGTGYLDQMKGSILSSSRAFTGGSFFGNGSNTIPALREHKSNGSLDHVQTSAARRGVSQLERACGKTNINGDDKNINRPVLVEPQTFVAPKKSWQQLFTCSAASAPSVNSNVISRPNVKSQAEVQSPPFSVLPPSKQLYDNPISFGLPSPFSLSSFPYGSRSSNIGLPLASEAMFSQIGGSREFLPEVLDIYEDPCYVPDPISLLGPVSESLDNFQLDLGFVADTGLENPRALNCIPAPSDIKRSSPTESPMSRPQMPEEKHAGSFLFPSSPKVEDTHNLPLDDLSSLSEKGTWQMWNTSPLGQDGLGFVDGSPNWLLPSETNRQKKEDVMHPVPQKTMASLFQKDDQVLSGIPSPQNVFLGNYQNASTYSTSLPGTTVEPWLPKSLFGPMSGNDTHFPPNPHDETTRNEMICGSPCGSASNHPLDFSPANCWAKKGWTVQGSVEGIGNTSIGRPHVGGLYSIPDVQSLQSYD